MRIFSKILGGFLVVSSVSAAASLHGGNACYAQYRHGSEVQDSTEVTQRPVARRFLLYYVNDQINLDETYLENGDHIREIKKYLAISPKIDSITIEAFSSPEGRYDRNVWLAHERAVTAKRLIVSSTPEGSSLTPDKIKLRPGGENWDGLKAEVEANYTQSNRQAVLDILNSNLPADSKKARIRGLDGGRTWRYLIDNYMPRLRMATWVCVWIDPKVPQVAALPVQPVDHHENIEITPPYLLA